MSSGCEYILPTKKEEIDLLNPCLFLQPSSFFVSPLLHKLLSSTVFLAVFLSAFSLAFHVPFPLPVLFVLKEMQCYILEPWMCTKEVCNWHTPKRGVPQIPSEGDDQMKEKPQKTPEGFQQNLKKTFGLFWIPPLQRKKKKSQKGNGKFQT